MVGVGPSGLLLSTTNQLGYSSADAEHEIPEVGLVSELRASGPRPEAPHPRQARDQAPPRGGDSS